MIKKEPLTELAKFTGEKYADETLKIVQNNVRLSTKMAAILCMLEAYYVEFSQNQKELIRMVDKATSEKSADDDVHLKQIKRTSKNKLNRIHNQENRFDKFYKEFKSEFTKYFGDEGKTGKMEESLLDAFEVFWDNVVKIDENSVSVKENL
jgi:hypothetical protein